jgi:threonine dehydrogenase-like Zn-dependent dehydrogenase
MRAVTCTDSELAVVELPDPQPAQQHVLLEVLRCGICGSDLHARHHADELASAAAATGYDDAMRPQDTVVLGHEFVGEVLEPGKGVRGFRPGSRVVAMPLLRVDGTVHPTGLSRHAPGAYAERVSVEAALAMEVPNGLDTDVAALTEPMAVALHAVRRGQVKKGQAAVVVGCGPIGLAVIGMLRAQGVRTVVASDLSPARRALAERMGADVVVDPTVDSPYEAFDTRDYVTEAAQMFDLAVDSMRKLRAVPKLPWWHVMRAAEVAGKMPEGPVVFECVGVPGIIDQIVTEAPLVTRVVVVGVTMAPDTIRPSIAINKEIDLRFVLGYTPREFREALHLLADGKVDGRVLLTGTVGLEGVEAAFDVLGRADAHAKILIDPASATREVSPAATAGRPRP